MKQPDKTWVNARKSSKVNNHSGIEMQGNKTMTEPAGKYQSNGNLVRIRNSFEALQNETEVLDVELENQLHEDGTTILDVSWARKDKTMSL